jgi:hypothetical protein
LFRAPVWQFPFPLEERILTRIRHFAEHLPETLAFFRVIRQQGFTQDPPVFFFHGNAMFACPMLQVAYNLALQISDKQLCHGDSLR